MVKVFFDLDGVLRDLASACGHELRTYDHPTPNGQSVSQYVNDRLDLLRISPVTPYFRTISAFGPIHIISMQPAPWRANTIKWLNLNFGSFNSYSIDFVYQPDEKLRYLQDGAYIVEDYPKFPPEAYKNVILIDYPYNRNIDCFARVRSPKQLEIILRGLKG